MPNISVDIRLNQGAMKRLLQSPHGAVGTFIHRVGVEVEHRARQNAPVKSGKLRSSIGITLWPGPRLALEVSANIEYALAVHQGVKARPIESKSGKMLRFPNKAGVIIYAKRAPNWPGFEGQPFLMDALSEVINTYR